MGPLLGVFLGGGLGALCRYGVGVWAGRLLPDARVPWGTFSVNVAGCFVLGALVPLFAVRLSWPAPVRLAVTTGFLGGLTTFSTFGQESVALASRAPALGLANVALNVGVGLAAATLGMWLGGRLT
ncbi:MAG: fluoride efflux transporter CrcB [Myxococcales bacterium]|nr:fluoride efflux transporter CrcB [Myxococcales bacterium]